MAVQVMKKLNTNRNVGRITKLTPEDVRINGITLLPENAALQKFNLSDCEWQIVATAGFGLS
jgi:hypothetical protein